MRKIETVQVLRAIACIAIYIHHYKLLEIGEWAVSVFIILSGFIMYYSYNNRVLEKTFGFSVKFSIKKICRLYSLHIITMCFSLIISIYKLFKCFSYDYAKLIFLQVISNTLLIKNIIPNKDVWFSLNGPSWYLGLSMFFYFFTPCILFWLKQKSKKNTIFIMLFVYLTQISVCYAFGTSIYVKQIDWLPMYITYLSPLFRIGDYILGCCLGKLIYNSKIEVNNYVSTVFELIVIIINAGVIMIYLNNDLWWRSEWFKYDVLFTIPVLLLVALFSLNKGYISKILTNKVIVHIGDISAYIFLLHNVVIQYMNEVFRRIVDLNKYYLIISCIIFCILLALTELYIRIENTKIFRIEKSKST